MYFAFNVLTIHLHLFSLFRIFRIIDTQPSIPTTGGLWPTRCEGKVTFSQVNFTYPTRSDVPVLTDFSLTVEPNQTVALVGASGSGNIFVCKECVLCCTHMRAVLIILYANSLILCVNICI